MLVVFRVALVRPSDVSDEPYPLVPGCESGSARDHTEGVSEAAGLMNGSYELWKTLNSRI
jgi:hypothetical protein